jgi:cell division protein ZapA (FtsZ GTPase activity inhibitor)
MSRSEHSVEVTIGGHKLVISSEHPAEYTRAVAAHFDETLQEIRASLPTVDGHRAAILAGLAVTDQLFQTRHAGPGAVGRIEAVRERLARLLPPAKRGPKAQEPVA